MNKTFTAAGVIAMAALFSASAFAESGNISIPGVLQAAGSSGSKIKNSTITVKNNTANDVLAGGGEASIIELGASVKLNGIANVNTVNVTGSEVTDSHILVEGNTATKVHAVGGTANVNSININ